MSGSKEEWKMSEAGNEQKESGQVDWSEKD